MAKSDAERARDYRERKKQEKGSPRKVWSLIFYPDSAPEEWCDLLSELHLKIWVSPLHDRDTWTAADAKRNPEHAEGMAKKPHYHLVVEYPVSHYMDDVRAQFQFLNGSSYIVPVESLISMVRYLAHQDDPDKAQYSIDDIRTFGGAELDLTMQLGSWERHEALKSMRAFIKVRGFIDFCEFVDYCDEHEKTWARLLDDNSSYIIEKYIKSRRYMLKDRDGINARDEAHQTFNALHARMKKIEENYRKILDK